MVLPGVGDLSQRFFGLEVPDQGVKLWSMRENSSSQRDYPSTGIYKCW